MAEQTSKRQLALPSILVHFRAVVLAAGACWALILGVSAMPAVAVAGPALSAPGAQNIAAIKAELDSIAEDPAWARGEFADREVAAAKMRAAEQALRRADRAYAMLGMWDQKTPEARAIAQAIAAKKTYYNKVLAALAGSSAGSDGSGSGGGAGGGAGGGTSGAGKDGAAAAGPMSRAGDLFVRNMQANFPGVDPANPLCKGAFGAEQERDAGDLESAIDRGLGLARMSANRLDPADRQHPQVAAELARLAGLEACKGVIAKRRATLAKEDAGNSDRHHAFLQEAHPHREVVERLLVFVEEPDNRMMYTPNAADIRAWRTALEAVHGLCTGKYAGVRNDPKWGQEAIRNPELWCKLAAIREEVMRKLAMNHLRVQSEQEAKQFRKLVVDFDQRSGYIAVQGDMVELALFEPAAFKAQLRQRADELLREAGVAEPPELWADFDAARGALWAKIDEKAPTWTRPAKAEAGAPANAAKAVFGKLAPGNNVKAAYITRADWQIFKNSAGVPLRRTKPGYVVYKTKADAKWCRGRSWTYKEEYAGRGYQASKEVSEFGFIRFESCD